MTAEPHEGCCLHVFTSVMRGQDHCKGKQLASDLLHPSYPADHKGCSVPIFYAQLDQRLGLGATLHTATVTRVVRHLTSCH